jgi:hypothetical protein
MPHGLGNSHGLAGLWLCLKTQKTTHGSRLHQSYLQYRLKKFQNITGILRTFNPRGSKYVVLARLSNRYYGHKCLD